MTQLETALETFQQHDALAAIDQIARQDDGVAAAKTFVEVMRHFYWKEKQLTASIVFAQAGAHYALFQAARIEPTEPAMASQLRGIAKGLMYDIASFTWPGWDEPGIAITATELLIGLGAAKANLRLARELNKGDLPLSRAYWMLAGHHLCGRDYHAAEDHYELAARHAATAGAKSEELLAAGFVRLAGLFISPGNAILQAQLDGIQRDLMQLENGPDFVQQMRTALRVFSGFAGPPAPPASAARAYP
jgi:hypothetical protein